MDILSIFGIKISNISTNEGIAVVKEWLQKETGKYYIVTPNPEIIMHARRDPEFKGILNNAGLAIPDGAGLIWAGKILGTPFRERITGVDFMYGLCKMAAENGFTIGLLGARPGIAAKAAEKLRNLYPEIKISFTAAEWDNNTQYSILNAPIDLLFVAFGAPKQEKWIASHINSIPVRVAMGVGGSFDYLSGIVSRAPSWMRRCGLEWLYRLLKEPWRFRRQLAIWGFGFLILREKFSLASK